MSAMDSVDLPPMIHVDKANDEKVLDEMMKTILTNDRRPGKEKTAPPEKLAKEKVLFLNHKVKHILLQESTLVEIDPPIVICGDVHGQFADLLDIMDNVQWPPKQRYLFMGDYVDRGDQSIELICLLFLLKIKHPHKLFMLRGNHETAEVNSMYGFKDDCLLNYDFATWDAFQESFKCLPLVACVGQRILCMHGGLSPYMFYIDRIRKIPRPVEIPEMGLVCDLLWSDPLPKGQLPVPIKCCGFPLNRNRNTSVWFCSDNVKEFLKRNDLDLIVRAHELVDDGYEFTTDKKVLTIFTAPNYCDHPNDAAVLKVDEQLRCQILTFKFLKTVPLSQSGSILKNVADQELWSEITVREKPVFL